MVVAMKEVFQRLASEVRSRGQEHAAPVSLDALRFIDGGDDDKDALQHAAILHVERVPGVGAIALLRWRSRYVFSMPSLLRPAVGVGEDATEVVVNAGLSSLLFGHPETELIVPDVLALVDAIFGDNGSYSITTVAPFFCEYAHYWTRSSLDDAKSSEAWSRCQALCARSIVAAATSRWTNGCRVLFERVCSGSAARVAGPSLLAAAIAGTWSHTFLEVYRALEALFRVVCVEDLIAKLPPDASVAPRAALVDALEETLQWRLRQDSTLSRLVARLPDADANQIAAHLGVAPEGIASAVYKARNLIAHGALFASPIANREGLLSACLMLVGAAYDVAPVADLWFADA